MKGYKPIIAIDFDMTISNNRDYRVLINPPITGAVEAIKEMKDMGCTLILWTCRSGAAIDAAKEYLAKYGILDCFTCFNEDAPDVRDTWGTGNRKIYADVYIDDKNVGAVINWHEIMRTIKSTIWADSLGKPPEASK